MIDTDADDIADLLHRLDTDPAVCVGCGGQITDQHGNPRPGGGSLWCWPCREEGYKTGTMPELRRQIREAAAAESGTTVPTTTVPDATDSTPQPDAPTDPIDNPAGTCGLCTGPASDDELRAWHGVCASCGRRLRAAADLVDWKR